MTTLKNYIMVLENIIPDNFCNLIIEEYKNNEEWSFSNLDNGKIDKSYRNSESIFISNESSINKNLKARKEIDNVLFKLAEKAINKYVKHFPYLLVREDCGYELLKYNVGQFTKTHIDCSTFLARTISCSFCLNDEYEGGSWGFWDMEYTFKAPKGAIVLFPSNFMYPHEITTITKGTRYSIVTWFK